MDKNIRLFIIISIILLLVTIGFPFIVNIFYPPVKDSPSLGDSYGTLNTLFSGLAFAGIIVTILIQKNELKHQREELALQREEMKNTRKEFLTNRITTIIYNQLERYEYLINSFQISSQSEDRGLPEATKVVNTKKNDRKGNSAFSFISNLIKSDEVNYSCNSRLSEGFDYLSSTDFPETFRIVNRNIEEFMNFVIPAKNIVDVVRESLIFSGLDGEDIEQLKRLFIRNIGSEQIAIYEGIVFFLKDFKILYDKHGIYDGEDFDDLNEIKDSLENIIFFVSEKLYVDEKTIT